MAASRRSTRPPPSTASRSAGSRLAMVFVAMTLPPRSSDLRQERRRRPSVQPKSARGEPVAEMNRQGLGALPDGFARNRGQPGDRVNSRSPEDAGPEQSPHVGGGA